MLHNPDKKVEDLAKALRNFEGGSFRSPCVSYLYMLIETDKKHPVEKKDRFASYELAMRIEQLYNVPKESVMKTTLFGGKKKTSIFEKLKRRIK